MDINLDTIAGTAGGAIGTAFVARIFFVDYLARFKRLEEKAEQIAVIDERIKSVKNDINHAFMKIREVHIAATTSKDSRSDPPETA